MSQSQLLKEKRFYPLFWTQFFGAFNDNFLKNALIILITFKGVAVLGLPPSLMVAAAGGIFILPFFLFSATAGQIADRFEKSQIIRIIKLVEIAIMALASAGFLTHYYELLLLALFLMGLHSTFFGPIKYSILPQHLQENELVGGNALVEAGTFIAILLGTIAGGVLVMVPGSGPSWVSVGLFFFAILGYWACRGIPLAPATDPTIQVEWNPITPTWKIFKFTRQNRPVFLSLLGISWFWFVGAAVLSLFPPYCKDVLMTNETVVTLFLAIFSVGVGLGSLLCERLSRGWLELGLVPLGSIGMTLFILDLFLVGTPRFAQLANPGSIGVLNFLSEPQGIRVAVDLFLFSVFSGFFIVPLYTMIQERSEPSHRSRVIAGNNILNALFMVVASVILMGLFKAGVKIPTIFLMLALMNGLASAYIYTLLPEFLLRFLCWCISNVMYRLKIEGEENIPEKGPILVVCNHVSFIDWMIVAAGCKRPVRFVIDFAFTRSILVRGIMKSAKVIPITTAREDLVMMNQAFEKVAVELKDEQAVCIFPEGKITRDGKLGPFRPGVEKILSDTPVTVIPMALVGLWGSFFSRKDGPALKKIPRRFWSRVTLRIGKPIPPSEASSERLFKEVAHFLGEDGVMPVKPNPALTESPSS